MCEKYFFLTNSVATALGGALLGYGCYSLVQNTSVYGDYTPYLPVAIGAALMFVGMLGNVGAKKNSTFLLVLYIGLTLLVTTLVFCAGAFLLVFGGYLDNVKEGDLSNKVMQGFSDFQIAIFNGCCAEKGFGELVGACSDNNTTPCITFTEDYDSYLKDVDTVCEFLEDIKIDGVPIVGNTTTTPGACGGGDAETFIDALSEHIQEHLNILGGVTLGVSVFLLLLLVSSCTIFCKARKEAKARAKAKQDMTAGQITGLA